MEKEKEKETGLLLKEKEKETRHLRCSIIRSYMFIHHIQKIGCFSIFILQTGSTDHPSGVGGSMPAGAGHGVAVECSCRSCQAAHGRTPPRVRDNKLHIIKNLFRHSGW